MHLAVKPRRTLVMKRRLLAGGGAHAKLALACCAGALPRDSSGLSASFATEGRPYMLGTVRFRVADLGDVRGGRDPTDVREEVVSVTASKLSWTAFEVTEVTMSCGSLAEETTSEVLVMGTAGAVPTSHCLSVRRRLGGRSAQDGFLRLLRSRPADRGTEGVNGVLRESSTLCFFPEISESKRMRRWQVLCGSIIVVQVLSREIESLLESSVVGRELVGKYALLET